ncbi:MAG: molybdopterin oxidoreductase [Sulfurospirillum sp.]|nr:MAG: molybdopterin oxidoreductase [Sulfurospirillum sp.]
MGKLTACPLDCYDGCSVVYEEGKLKGDPNHPFTRGYLCPNLNSFLATPTILKPIFKGKEISLDEALEILNDKLSKVTPDKTLYYKGNGNFALMGNIVGDFFAKFGAVFTRGSLCDSAGEFGVKEAVGTSLHMSFDSIAKSETIIVWGRNIETTNSHMLPFLKDKNIIVIDPIVTNIAKEANLHIQIRPKDDMKLAILLARFFVMQQMVDSDFIENRCENFDYFIDFINSYRVKFLMRDLGISAKEINHFIDLVDGKKCAFLVGVGVQKYRHGHSVLHMIYSLFAMLGNFGKEGCGVSYLSNSSFGFELPFEKSSKSEPIVNVDFSKYDLCFIQGSNPANQMPNTKSVVEHLKNSPFKVYFGLYENETSSLCDLVIPAKSFLAKEDIRLSYGHSYIHKMPRLRDEDGKISEYELSSYLHKRFDFKGLESEQKIIEEIIGTNGEEDGQYLLNSSCKDEPYSKQFYTDEELFEFIDEIDLDEDEDDNRLYLITAKSKHSLNSQFKRSSFVYLPRSLGFSDGDLVEVKSDFGSYNFVVKNDYRLRDDTILIYSGTKGVNYLTPSFLSDEGDGACYQEARVSIVKLN